MSYYVDYEDEAEHERSDQYEKVDARAEAVADVHEVASEMSETTGDYADFPQIGRGDLHSLPIAEADEVMDEVERMHDELEVQAMRLLKKRGWKLTTPMDVRLAKEDLHMAQLRAGGKAVAS